MSAHHGLRPDIASLRAYEEGERQPIDLASNTNQFLPSAASAYPPSPDAELLAAAAASYDVSPAHIFAASGSDQAMDVCLRAILAPGDRVVAPTPTFGMVRIFAIANHGTYHEVDLKDGALDVEAFTAASARVRYLCRPNNPTGTSVPAQDVQAILDADDAWLIVDEAYAEFADDDLRQLIGHPRLVILRTLSKAYGVAGARVGFLLGPEPLVAAANALAGPYLVNHASRTLALQTLADPAPMHATVAAVQDERPRWHDMLARHGIACLPSQANFLYARHPEPERLRAHMATQGIGIRAFPDAIRITLGPAAIRAQVDAALASYGGPS